MRRERRPSHTEDGHTAEPAERPGERPSERLSVAVVVTLIGAILAALISGTTLVFELWPGLKPDPKEKVAARLEVLEMDKNIDYAEYLDRPGRKVSTNPAKLEEREQGLNFPGNVFYLRGQIEGFKRESLRLEWFTYAENGHRNKEDEARSEKIFEPDSPVNTQVAPVWVKEPGEFDEDNVWASEDGEYFVRFELYDGDVLLAFKDSAKFKIR